jgi:hypothetical protein
MTLVRIPFQAAARAGAVQLLTDFKADVGINLQIYPGRPRSVQPPTAFIDSINETIGDYFATQRQRQPSVEVIVLHGVFDYAETVSQRDAFVDGFLDWVADRFHAFGANTLVEVTSVTDIPVFVPDWQPPEQQRQYYGTRITLEGLATT